MAEYQLTDTVTVIRNADGAHIPDDPRNPDRQEYDRWLAAGGVPDPWIDPSARGRETDAWLAGGLTVDFPNDAPGLGRTIRCCRQRVISSTLCRPA